MLHKKALLITIVFLLIFTESVIAIPKTKDPKYPKPETPKKPNIPKKESILFTEKAILGAGNVYLGNQEITQTGILHVENALSQGKFNEGNTPISGLILQTTMSGIYDLNTYFGSYSGKWIITSQSGKFEGTITGTIDVATISGKFIGHGIGEFTNQKIKGTFNGAVNNYQVEIFVQATISTKTE